MYIQQRNNKRSQKGKYCFHWNFKLCRIFTGAATLSISVSEHCVIFYQGSLLLLEPAKSFIFGLHTSMPIIKAKERGSTTLNHEDNASVIINGPSCQTMLVLVRVILLDGIELNLHLVNH
jgi:hypothetical protein